jgi:hypothetical protein
MIGMRLKSEIVKLELSDLGREWHVNMHHAWRIPLAL